MHRFGGQSPNWEIVAWYTMIGGIVGALIAAVPGFIDLLSLPHGVQRTGIKHMALNLTIVVLFAINAYIRRDGVTDASLFSVSLDGWEGKWSTSGGVAVDTAAAGEATLGRARYSGPERRSATSRLAYSGPERRMAMQ